MDKTATVPGDFGRLNPRITLTERSPPRPAGFSDIPALLEQKPRRCGAVRGSRSDITEDTRTRGRASEKFMTCEGAAADVLTQIRGVQHRLLKPAGVLIDLHQQRRDRRLLGAVAAMQALPYEPRGSAGRRRRGGPSITAGVFSSSTSAGFC